MTLQKTAQAILRAREADFAELARIACLDPKTDFRGADLHDVDFGTDDLAAFDFGGADFSGANLLDARGLDPDNFLGCQFDSETKAPPWLFGPARPGWAHEFGRDEYGFFATLRIPNGIPRRKPITQRLRWIKPGWFMMGSDPIEAGSYDDEWPRHRVDFARGFWMFDTAVTEALWTAVTGEPAEAPLGPRYPVTNVGWIDARAFVQRLNEGLPGLWAALPSEAQWEYTCRAGTESPYVFGQGITRRQVCYASRKPVPVGSLPANAWGLYEMHGNVWEWCEDHWHDSYRGAPTNGSAWIIPEGPRFADRVLRGGSYGSPAADVRSTSRVGNHPGARNSRFSFRCVLTQN